MNTLQKSNTTSTNIEQRRSELIVLSQKAREYREIQLNNANNEEDFIRWSTTTINDIIADSYRNRTGATVFKTLKQWNQLGYRVNKGEKAFTLWGRKKEVKEKKENKQDSDNEVDYEFYPIAFLFSDQQVKIGGTAK